MALADLLSQLDSRPAVRGRQFEQLCGWYLQNAPEYRERIRRVWLWSEWPDAWAADAGIDLVAEDQQGGLWAVQAKAYDSAYAIKKSDIDSFLSESSRPHFSYRLLIATTDRLGPTARRTLDSQREPGGYVLRSQLELAHVTWPPSPQDLRPRRAPRKTPLPHVWKAVEATTRGLEGQARGQLIMACGTGKTLAGMWVAERLGSRRTLVLVPSLSLLGQTLREWAANASQPFEYLAVCSDQTVTGKDEFVQHTAELGVPVTTNPGAVAAFLRRRGQRVVFSTYQSSSRVAAAYQGRTPRFDLAIADEAHRCAGRVSGEFATILDASRIKSRRRLFMTATPRVYTPRLRREARLVDVEVASMDDENVFGPVLHRLTFGEAIERNLLSDYQVVVVGVDDDMYRGWAERGEFVTRDGERITDARTLAAEIAVAKAIAKYDLRRVITFHGRIKTAAAFSRDIADVIDWMPASARPSRQLWTEHVSGAMSSGHRDRLLLRFRHLDATECGLLSNARCLGEGVDVPTLDGIAFIDPRHSTIDIIQAVGRAIRKAPDKRVGTIVLPVFLSTASDPEHVLDDSSFRHVWDVVKALRAHDEALGEELDALRRSLGQGTSHLRPPGKLILDVPSSVGIEFACAFAARTVEWASPTWEFGFGRLQRYVMREGHARVPQHWCEDGFKLGNWVVNQRQDYRRNTLASDRAERLASSPRWAWDSIEAAWEEGLAALRRYVSREGHSRVPRSVIDGDGFCLGNWVQVQRSFFTRGILSAERAARLEAIQDWSWTPMATAWEHAFARLDAFVARTGHARVPQEYREHELQLGAWVTTQRSNRRTGRLDDRLAHRLEGLPGWSWDPHGGAWERAFAVLLSYVTQQGHARVPLDHVEDGFRLGHWVSTQRRLYRRRPHTISAHRIARLERLPGWTWTAGDDAWKRAFRHLEAFAAEHQHVNVAQTHVVNGFKLGSWVAEQRQQHRRGNLTTERIAALEQLDRWSWQPHEATWNQHFAALIRYVEREGHAQVPALHREGDVRLGNWVDQQRQKYRKGTLPSARKVRLDDVSGWRWTVRAPKSPRI